LVAFGVKIAQMRFNYSIGVDDLASNHNANGAVGSRLSMTSNTPPIPGRIRPESLAMASRFRMLSAKSQHSNEGRERAKQNSNKNWFFKSDGQRRANHAA
jgi:hypothetical protein